MDRLLLYHLMSFDDHRLSFCNQPAAPLILRKADKSPESAVEPSERRPALTVTYEANPPRGSYARGLRPIQRDVGHEKPALQK